MCCQTFENITQLGEDAAVFFITKQKSQSELTPLY